MFSDFDTAGSQEGEHAQLPGSAPASDRNTSFVFFLFKMSSSNLHRPLAVSSVCFDKGAISPGLVALILKPQKSYELPHFKLFSIGSNISKSTPTKGSSTRKWISLAGFHLAKPGDNVIVCFLLHGFTRFSLNICRFESRPQAASWLGGKDQLHPASWDMSSWSQPPKLCPVMREAVFQPWVSQGTGMSFLFGAIKEMVENKRSWWGNPYIFLNPFDIDIPKWSIYQTNVLFWSDVWHDEPICWMVHLGDQHANIFFFCKYA